jgi:hypothetical protein
MARKNPLIAVDFVLMEQLRSVSGNSAKKLVFILLRRQNARRML